jgi:hypothetical protein
MNYDIAEVEGFRLVKVVIAVDRAVPTAEMIRTAKGSQVTVTPRALEKLPSKNLQGLELAHFVFFHPQRQLKRQEIMAARAALGLKPNIKAQIAANTENPSFRDHFPNGYGYRDLDGNHYRLSFYKDELVRVIYGTEIPEHEEVWPIEYWFGGSEIVPAKS